jgi:Carbohydrate esterase, sialic acid-specific acetylesterase
MDDRIRPVLCLLLLLAFCGPIRVSADDAELPPRERFHLFLLVGQSNMAGRGKVADEDRQPHPRVLMLTRDNHWAPAVAPLHFDKPGIAGVGIGRTFGFQIAEANKGVTVGLIPCAVGGSPIASWEPGAFYAPTNSHPYDDAIRRARQAMKAGVLKGILWHQGESDSTPGKAEVYEKKLHELIARLRKDLDAPDVPFIAGQMGQFPGAPWSDAKKLVDQAQRDLPKHVAHTAFVPSDGLTHKGDKIHFNSKSYHEFGRRYAAAYLKLASGPDK